MAIRDDSTRARAFSADSGVFHNPKNLRRGLQVVGACFLLAGAGTAAYLYQSFGVTLPEKAIYAVIGVLLAASGGLLLPAALSLWRSEHPLMGVAAGFIWLAALFPLGVQHHAGFFSVAQADLAAAGLGAQIARAELTRLEHEQSDLQDAAGLNLDTLKTQAEKIKAEINSLEKERAQCPASYFKNCLNPLAEKITTAQAALTPIEKDIKRARQYNGLLAEKETATKRLKAESTGATGSAVHPLFDTQGKIAGIDPKVAQAAFLGFTAVTVEMLSAVLFVFAGGLGGKQGDERILSAQTIPALAMGGRVTGDGLAYVHRGEIVLNADAAEEMDKLHPGLMDTLNQFGCIGANEEPLEATPKKTEPVIVGEPKNAGEAVEVRYVKIGETRDCLHCGKPFSLTRRDKKYCSRVCKDAAWEARTGARLRNGR